MHWLMPSSAVTLNTGLCDQQLLCQRLELDMLTVLEAEAAV